MSVAYTDKCAAYLCASDKFGVLEWKYGGVIFTEKIIFIDSDFGDQKLILFGFYDKIVNFKIKSYGLE